MKDEYISVEHIMLGLLDMPNSHLKELFEVFNFSKDAFLKALMSVRGNTRVTSDNPEDTYNVLKKYGSELVELAKRHLAKSIEIKGDRVGVLEMRRHLSCYFKGLPDFKETRLKLVTLNDPTLLFETLDSIAERWGEEAPAATNVYEI